MTRQLELIAEERTKRRHAALVRCMEFELVGSLAAAGVELTGFSVKLGDGEALVTLRGIRASEAEIAFVGAGELVDGLLKCVRDAKADRLKWRTDKYA